jgi:hypothetical protein
MPRLTKAEIARLLQAVNDTLRAREALVAESDGRLTVQTFPRGEGFDVELTVRTR